jgi:penicillin amidase
MLEAFSSGVNRYILDRRGRLPWEFVALRYDPKPWAPADTLLVGAYLYKYLTSSWRAELRREQLTARVGPERARELYVEESPLDQILVGAQETSRPPRARPRPAARRAPDGAGAMAWESARQVLQQFDAETQALVGSNNWVVDGRHTASGKPLLANDTHLQLDMPCIWYLVHVTAPGWNVKGFALPGVPLVVIGHNDRIAWGYTNSGADVQDLYVEKFNPANPREYRAGGAWRPAEVREERIRVRGAPDETLEVVVTRHGPVVHRAGGRAYALRWTALEPGGMNSSALRVGAARNWPEFLTALRDVTGPAQNTVYADVDGNIGYIVAARVPVRRNGDGSVPVPGDTDDYEWTGYIPFEELPQLFNPPEGLLATANSRIAGPGYRRHLTRRWMPPHRAAGIYARLRAGAKFRPEDFIRIQADILSPAHRALAEELLRAREKREPADARVRSLLDRLRGWGGRAEAGGAETVFVEYTRRAFLRSLLRPLVGEEYQLYDWFNAQVFVEWVLRERPPQWLPKDYAGYDDLLIACAERAAAQLEQESGSRKAHEWRWGRFISITMRHPLGRVWPLTHLLNIGPVEQSGTSFSIKQTGRTFGPSMRFVADLADLDNSLMNITAGQSGHPLSPHYRDQFPAWLEGRGLASPFSDAAWQKAAVHRLRLVPSPARD